MRPPFLSIRGLQSLYQSQKVPKIFDCTFILKGPPTGYDIYKQGHLPQAMYFDIDACAVPSNLPHMWPTEAIFENYVQSLGVKDKEDDILLYASKGIFPAMRVWYMFKAFGHNPHKIQILEGGIDEWAAHDLPVEVGESIRAPSMTQDPSSASHYHATLNPSSVKYYSDVIDIIEGKGDGVIVDARSSGRFSGLESEPRPGLSSGHMPNAVNMPFSELLNSSGTAMKDVSELEKIFTSKGLKKDQKIVFSCGSGLTACVLARAADLIGCTNYSVYDGSWTEYASNPLSKIVKEKPENA